MNESLNYKRYLDGVFTLTNGNIALIRNLFASEVYELLSDQNAIQWKPPDDDAMCFFIGNQDRSFYVYPDFALCGQIYGIVYRYTNSSVPIVNNAERMPYKKRMRTVRKMIDRILAL